MYVRLSACNYSETTWPIPVEISIDNPHQILLGHFNLSSIQIIWRVTSHKGLSELLFIYTDPFNIFYDTLFATCALCSC